jgi:hypothetical protein
MAERTRGLASAAQQEALPGPTRPVALYRAQPVVRSTLVPEPTTTLHRSLASAVRSAKRGAIEPATRCYPSGLLEELQGRGDASVLGSASSEPTRSVAAPRAQAETAARSRRWPRPVAAALSRRSAALVGVCFAVAVGVVLWPRPAAPARHSDTAPFGASNAAGASASAASSRPDRTSTARARAQPSASSPAQPPSSEVQQPPPRAHASSLRALPSSPGTPPSPRVAAEALARGRYREALDAYRQLADANPDSRVYAHLAAVIARRWTERCAQAESSGEAPCAQPEH